MIIYLSLTVHDDKLVTTRINADLDELDERHWYEPFPFLDEHLGHPGQSTSMSIHDESRYVLKPILTPIKPSFNSGQDACRHLEGRISKLGDCNYPFYYR